MKKLTIILILFLFSENSFAKIIELNKCYLKEDTSIRKEGLDKFKSFKEANDFSEYTNLFILKDYNKFRNWSDGELQRAKKNISKTYNLPFEDVLYLINTKKLTVTRMWVVTDEAVEDRRKYIREIENIARKLKKEGKEIPWRLASDIHAAELNPPKKMWQTSPQKIKQYYDTKIIYEDKDGRNDLFIINLKTGEISIDWGERWSTKISKEICQIGGKKRSHYLDYWWAVILIIAITFFIFTQSGKRLKQIRRK